MGVDPGLGDGEPAAEPGQQAGDISEMVSLS